MDRRKHWRVAARLPVRLWGVDAYGQPFIELATVVNISSTGALLQGFRRQVRPGEILEVQFEAETASYRVAWVGEFGSRRQGEIGIEKLSTGPHVWQIDLRSSASALAMG